MTCYSVQGNNTQLLHLALLKIKFNCQIYIEHWPVLRRWLQFPAGSWRVSASGQTSGQCNHSINSQLYLNNSKNCNRNVFPRSPHRFMSSSSFPLGSQGKNGGTFGFCHNPIPKFNYMTQLELISA